MYAIMTQNTNLLFGSSESVKTLQYCMLTTENKTEVRERDSEGNGGHGGIILFSRCDYIIGLLLALKLKCYFD